MRDGSLIGFDLVLHDFEEAETREYSGREVFSRTSVISCVADMVAVDSVLYIARDMRRFLSDVTDRMCVLKRPDGRQGNAWRLKHG